MEIIYKKVDELIPYVNNARTHSKEQINQICASINEYGFTNPILIDEKGMIIAGHGRLMASKQLKMEEVPCIELKGLTEAQKKAYIIADNKMTLNAGWDEELLKLELENLKELDFAKEKGFTGGKKYEQGIVDDFNPKMIDLIMSLDVKETFLWGADYFAELLPNKNDGSWIVWDKRANGNDDIEEDYSSDKMYGSCFELCWSKNRHKRDIARVKWAGVFGTEKEFDHKRYHPTQKPIKLCEWFIKKYSDNDNAILDLFGGSGSTLIACEQLNRKCYMMELDEHYVSVIIERYINFTGNDVYRINPDGTKTNWKEIIA